MKAVAHTHPGIDDVKVVTARESIGSKDLTNQPNPSSRSLPTSHMDPAYSTPWLMSLTSRPVGSILGLLYEPSASTKPAVPPSMSIMISTQSGSLPPVEPKRVLMPPLNRRKRSRRFSPRSIRLIARRSLRFRDPCLWSSIELTSFHLEAPAEGSPSSETDNQTCHCTAARPQPQHKLEVEIGVPSRLNDRDPLLQDAPRNNAANPERHERRPLRAQKPAEGSKPHGAKIRVELSQALPVSFQPFRHLLLVNSLHTVPPVFEEQHLS